MSDSSVDFVSERLGEIQATEDSQAAVHQTHAVVDKTYAVVQRTQWIAVFALLLAIALVAISLRSPTRLRTVENIIDDSVTQLTSARTEIVNTVTNLNTAQTVILNRLAASGPTVVHVPSRVQRWTSASFSSGQSVCLPNSAWTVNPCRCWRAEPQTSEQDCVDAVRIAASAKDVLLVQVNGGHDRMELNASLREGIGSNEALARERAQHVLDELLHSMPSQAPLVGVSTRGVWDATATYAGDRTVTITLVMRGSED